MLQSHFVQVCVYFFLFTLLYRRQTIYRRSWFKKMEMNLKQDWIVLIYGTNWIFFYFQLFGMCWQVLDFFFNVIIIILNMNISSFNILGIFNLKAAIVVVFYLFSICQWSWKPLTFINIIYIRFTNLWSFFIEVVARK